MFVQSSHFIEQEGEDTARRVVFYGQEKNPDTIRIAKMNLAVHGLEGKIAEAITYYQDEHTLAGKCDFVMANPPFNVDLVDAERVKSDPRLPFGLPGVNKQKKVSNANYLWISYFRSYLNEKGRAGFVMSSQASSAGHGEKDVRRKIVETGDVDVMLSIRGNFFYTRTVPCELWFFDRGKPAERKDKVLMLDARGIYRKVTRKIYDFSPEQMKNIAAIVWLHRGQRDRFLRLIDDYFWSLSQECAHVAPMVERFEGSLGSIVDRAGIDENGDALVAAATELQEAHTAYVDDRARLLDAIERYRNAHAKVRVRTNQAQHAARVEFDPISEALRGLIKQVDLLYKLASRLADRIGEAAADGQVQADRRALSRAVRQLDDDRRAAVEQLKAAASMHRQIVWLQERFPDAELRYVPGLVKLVDRADIEAADWSLTPGRYVGVAPPEDDEDFDFEQALRDIHVELADLNKQALELAARIQQNFAELGG